MSFEETVYEVPLEENLTSQNVEEDNCNFFISLRNDDNKNSSGQDQEQQPMTTDNETSTDENDIVLCAIWHSGYLGAAYYSRQESELFVLNDIVDVQPDYILTKTLFNQIKPSFTVTVGTMNSKFVRTLSTIIQRVDSEDDLLSESETVVSLPPNMQLLKKDKHSLEICTHTVNTLKLPCEPSDLTDIERQLYIQTLVNFDNKISLQALGSLILFLKTSGTFCSADGQILFLNINQVTIKDSVLMNSDAVESLKILSPKGQLPGDHTIFRLFNRCRSKIGQQNLKNLLLSPTNNLNVLRQRHEFIAFCLKPINLEVVSTIQQCLSSIYPITTALNKIHKHQYTTTSWRTLYITLHNITVVKRICRPFINEVAIFKEFVNEVSDVVENILEMIMETIDFENSAQRKVEVKIGINETLDQKKRYRSEIKEKITLAATYEINYLPPFISQCSIIYIPQMGYVVAIKKWSPTASYSDVEAYGYKHQFTIGDVFNFKSAVCAELDKCLGDIQSEIEDMENNVIDQLSEYIIKNSKLLKKPIQSIAQFDSLICMSQTAKHFGYICPNLVQENIIDIEEGKHPLADILNITNFVPNSYLSGGNNQVIKIITGANSSGKSVFLKQTALIVYLAHIGSFVPAKSATVGMMYSIHTNINKRLSYSTFHTSSFADPLTQMSQSVNVSKQNSLIIIDEFGRTTTELDGLSLLTSYLEHYLLREEFCPHILVSTHYLRVTNLIRESKQVEHLKCDIKIINDEMVFLYKIIKGVSNSFAKYAAARAGVLRDILKRSEVLLKCFVEGKPIDPA